MAGNSDQGGPDLDYPSRPSPLAGAFALKKLGPALAGLAGASAIISTGNTTLVILGALVAAVLLVAAFVWIPLRADSRWQQACREVDVAYFRGQMATVIEDLERANRRLESFSVHRKRIEQSWTVQENGDARQTKVQDFVPLRVMKRLSESFNDNTGEITSIEMSLHQLDPAGKPMRDTGFRETSGRILPKNYSRSRRTDCEWMPGDEIISGGETWRKSTKVVMKGTFAGLDGVKESLLITCYDCDEQEIRIRFDKGYVDCIAQDVSTGRRVTAVIVSPGEREPLDLSHLFIVANTDGVGTLEYSFPARDDQRFLLTWTLREPISEAAGAGSKGLSGERGYES